MTTTEPQLSVADPAQVGDRAAIIDTLVSAFHPDPVFEWVLPDPIARAAALPQWFAVWTDAYLAHEETYVIGDAGVEATALWSMPGVDPMEGEPTAAFEGLLGQMPGDVIERFATLEEMLDATHPKDIPNWYLLFLAAQPAHQGKGNGSMLLRQVLDVVDQRGEHAYLDATTPRNKALYERHGFVCIAEHRLPDGPSAYAMWREPNR